MLDSLQWFSNFAMHLNHPEGLLKQIVISFSSRKFDVGLKDCIFMKFPSNPDGVWTTF